MYNFDPSPVWSIFSLLIGWNKTGGTWRPVSEWVAIFEFIKFWSLCVWFWFHDSMTYVLFLTLILWSKGDLFIHLQWCSLKERNHSHLGRLQKPVLSPSNFFCEVALPFDQNLSMFAQDNTLFFHAIWNTMSTYDIDAWQNNCWNYVPDTITHCTFSSISAWLQKMKSLLSKSWSWQLLLLKKKNFIRWPSSTLALPPQQYGSMMIKKMKTMIFLPIIIIHIIINGIIIIYDHICWSSWNGFYKVDQFWVDSSGVRYPGFLFEWIFYWIESSQIKNFE